MRKVKERGSKGRKVLRHPFSRTTPKSINKGSHPKMKTRQQMILGKGQGNNLYNVRDVMVMQEHPHFIKRASARRKRRQLDKPAKSNFEFYLDIVAPPFK
jgi:hypothetical protein